MSEEEIRQLLKKNENARKIKQGDSKIIDGWLRELETCKKLDQKHLRTIVTLIGDAVIRSLESEESLFSLWDRVLGMGLRRSIDRSK